MNKALFDVFRRVRRCPRPRRIGCDIEQLELRTLLSASGPSAGMNFDLVPDPEMFDDRSILVRFRDEALVGATRNLSAESDGLGESFPLVPGLRQVRLDPGTNVASALAAYTANPSVLYAQPNYRVHVATHPGPPDDPLFHSLWGLNNTGQTGGTDDADIDALEAWGSSTGTGNTIVAVIDTGVDYTHPDLAANMWTNDDIPGNGLDDDGNGFIDDVHGYDFVNIDGDPMDDYGHGTHVSGTIGAVGDNGIGVTGVTWNVQIMALKFLDASGGGWTSDAILSLNYAVANGAMISNNSWGGGGFDQALYDAIQAAGNQGHIFVAAAGNDSSNNDAFPSYPATYNLDNIVSVAATDHNDQLAYFSNYGAATVDLGAPGDSILSTTPGNTYSTFSGTSMATPHVTGVMALVKGQHPEWTYDQVIQQVLTTVDPIAALDGLSVTGGRLNAAAAAGSPVPDTAGPRVMSSSPTGNVTGSVSQVRLRFNEAIDVATFDLADVASFVGPSGPINVDSVTPVAGSLNRQFDVNFAAQTALGDYTLVIGPDIRDVAGNIMDQDRDGLGGEVPQDQYTAALTISEVLQYCSTDVPAPIFDWTITISYLTIPDNVTIADLDVRLNVTHTYDGDLYMHLRSPSFNDVSLVEFRGGAGMNFSDTLFDDEASVPIANGSAPFAGSYQPEMPLSLFDGENAQGVWELWIEDWGFFDEGTLNSWCIMIQPGGGGGPPPGNQPPDAVDDYVFTDEDTPLTTAVLANDSDPDGDPLSVIAVGNVLNGSVVINGDQTLTFTPDPDFYGYGSFSYTISDPSGATDIASVLVEVFPVNDAPLAVDDNADAVPDTPLTFDGGFGNPDRLEANDLDVDGDFLSVVAVANMVNGIAELNWDGSVTFTPDPGFVGLARFDYTVSDGLLTDIGQVQINIRNLYYLSTTTDGTLTNSDGSSLTFDDSDILRLSVAGNGQFTYEIYFDGSDVGLTTSNEDIDAFVFLPDGDLIVSTIGSFSVPRPGGGTISGSGEDLLRFTPSSLGENTSGAWSWYFDGSDVGLNGSNENIDGVAVLQDGRIVISTAGNVSVTGVSGADVDLLAFTPVSLGSFTSGSWEMYFDGSDVSLSNSTAEDIDALFIRESWDPGVLPHVLFSTRGNFSVPGAAGANEDVVAFNPTSLGPATAGNYDSNLAFDGSLYGLASFDVDGIFIGLPVNQGPPLPQPIPALGILGPAGLASVGRPRSERTDSTADSYVAATRLPGGDPSTQFPVEQISDRRVDRLPAMNRPEFDAALLFAIDGSLLEQLASDVLRSRTASQL